MVTPPRRRRTSEPPPDADDKPFGPAAVVWGDPDADGAAASSPPSAADDDEDDDPFAAPPVRAAGSAVPLRPGRRHDHDAEDAPQRVEEDEEDDPRRATLAAERRLAPLLRRPLPLPRWMRRGLPADALPLYAYLTWSAYRDLGGWRRWTRFDVRRAPLLLLVVAAPLVLLDPRASTEAFLAVSALVVVVGASAMAGMTSAPSPWALWLENVARRGFLTELYLARVPPEEIIRAHYAARMAPSLLFATAVSLVLGVMAVAEQVFYRNDALCLALAFCGTLLLGALVFGDHGHYAAVRRARDGWSASAWAAPAAAAVGLAVTFGSLVAAYMASPVARGWVPTPEVVIAAGGAASAVQGPGTAAAPARGLGFPANVVAGTRRGGATSPPAPTATAQGAGARPGAAGRGPRAGDVVVLFLWALCHPLAMFPPLAVLMAAASGRAWMERALRDYPILWEEIVTRHLARTEG